MTTVDDRRADEPSTDNDQTPVGHGRMLRKEDPRFVRGKGRYVDDVQLPGMLHLAILRSPVAHARIVSIDTSAAAGAPEGQGGRHRRDAGRAGAGLDADAVQRRAGRAGHRQGALPGPGGRLRRRRGPVRRAGRARADRRRVRDPRARSSTSARALDAGRAGDPRRPRGQDRQPLLRLGDRRRGRDRGGLRPGRRRGRPQDIVYPRVHPAPMETCGAVADYDRVDGKLTLWSTTPGAARPPHALRDRRRAARAQDPGHRAGHRRRLRQQGADLPRLRLRDRRLDASPASR